MRAFFGIVLVGGAVLGAVMQGSFFSFLLIVCGIEYVLFPTTLILLIVAVVHWQKGRFNDPLLKRVGLAWCAIAYVLFIFWGTGSIVNRYQIDSVHAYVAKAVPLLESIKAQEGSYPTALPVSQLGSRPILLRDGGYTSDGKEFEFHYSNPAAFVGEGEQFNSSTKQWIHFDPMG